MKVSAKIAAIEIDDRDIRVTVVRTGGKTPVILEAHHATAEYDDPEQRLEAMIAAATEAVSAVKGPVTTWVLCVSSAYGINRQLRIPFRGRRKVEAVVPGELEPNLAIPIEDLIIDQEIVREHEGETDVLAIAMRRGVLEEQVEILTAAGAPIEAITVDVAALTSLWRNMRRSVNGMEAVLHVREQTSFFVLVTNKALVWYRNIPITLEQIHQSPERAVQEVRNSVRAFLTSWHTDETITNLTITGVSDDPVIRDAFEGSFDFTVAFEDLMIDLKGIEHIAATPPVETEAGEGAQTQAVQEVGEEVDAFAPLVGAAVSAAGTGYVFNFMTPDLGVKPSYSGLANHLVFTGILALIGILGYSAYLYMDYRANMQEINRIGEKIWAIHEQCFENSPIQERPEDDLGGRTTINLIEEQMLAHDSGPLSGVPVEWLAKPIFLDILLDLSQRFPGDRVKINEVSLFAGRRGQVAVKGQTGENDIDFLQQILRQIENTSDTLKDANSVIKIDGDTAEFELTANY